MSVESGRHVRRAGGRHRAQRSQQRRARGRHIGNRALTFDREALGIGRRPAKVLLTAGLGVAAMVAGAVFALASHGPAFIDLASTSGLTVTHDGVQFVQGGVGAGTGTFDPFVTASPGGSTSPESAITVCDNPGCPATQFDTFTGGGRTHELNLAAIPEINISGTLYREFSLDANDTGNDDYMSIDDIRILLDEQLNLGGFVPASDTFALNENAEPAVKVYDLDVPILMRSQGFTPGSGVSDITVLVPSTVFDAVTTDCSYGSLTCDQWVYFYFVAGALNPTTLPGGEASLPPSIQGKDWDVSAGFEEWRTRLLPVVSVEKTAVPSLTRSYDWTLNKEVSIDDGATWEDDESVDLFVGDSQDYLWRLIATKSAGVDSGQKVTGTIKVTNPTGGGANSVIEDSIPATINSLTDVLTLNGVPQNVTPVCPVSFPHVLAAGASFTCSYTVNVAATDDGTNVAKAIVGSALGDIEYTGDADVDWSTATVTEVDESATFADPEVPTADGETIVDSGTFTSSTQNYECGTDSLISNTATLTEDDTATERTDTATLDVDCHELSVEKDADTSFTTTYDWTLDKQVSIDDGTTWVDSATAEIAAGSSQDYLWRLVATRLDGVDSEWAVSGTITITNPAPIAATGVAVSDVLSISGAADVDCDPVAAGNQTTVDVAADGGTAECTYSKSLGAATDQTNTATATLFGHDVTGDADVDFSTATVTEVDETATLSDPEVLAGDEVLLDSGTFTSSTQSYLCGGGATITNTGNLTEDDSGTLHQDTADLTVTCILIAESCTPGFWQGGNGHKLWDSPSDQLAIDLGLSLQAAGYGNGEPFYSGADVATFFGPSGLDGTTLLGVVGTGGTNDWERKAMRDLIAALLNAEDNEINYPGTVNGILSDWATAVAGGVPGYKTFHAFYSAQNSDIGAGCNRTNDIVQLGLVMLPFLLLGGGELLRRRRGRHEEQ